MIHTHTHTHTHTHSLLSYTHKKGAMLTHANLISNFASVARHGVEFFPSGNTYTHTHTHTHTRTHTHTSYRDISINLIYVSILLYKCVLFVLFLCCILCVCVCVCAWTCLFACVHMYVCMY